MKCYVCGRSESDFEEFLRIESSKKTAALDNLRTQITSEKATYEASRKKFIDQKATISNIGSELASLKISTIKNDVATFQSISSSIATILEYHETYHPEGVSTVAEVIALILQEPMHSNLPSVVSREELIQRIESYKFDGRSVPFFERTIETSAISAEHVAMRRTVNALAEPPAGGVRREPDQHHKYTLCPICNSLFRDSSSAAFQAIQLANDYGEDHDD